jgi:hypothetical protein
MTQVAVTAVSTAIVSTFSTTTTIILMRYFPRILDNVESKVLKKEKKTEKLRKKSATTKTASTSD